MHPLYRAIVAVSVWSATAVYAVAQVRLAEKCEVSFATREEGIAAIIADDDFTRSLSRFDLQARMKSDAEVTLADWQKFVAGEVLEWQDDDRRRVTSILESIRDRLARIKVPLPENISLVTTSGKEEGDAAYCRGAFIVLPSVVVRRDKPQLETVLIHELFHVISNQNSQLQARLYAILGFKPVPPIAIHPSLRDRRITNPDAPLINCVMEIKTEESAPLYVTPVLYSSGPYDPKRKDNFFAYLVFKLMQVQPEGRGWKAADRDGKAIVLDPKNTPQFQEQIGRNTNYVVHPEEILADNFVHLVLEREKLPTPRIVEELKKCLAE